MPKINILERGIPMFRSLRLHDYILQHQTDQAIAEIAQTVDLNQPNDEGLTALQLASIEGESTVVYALLNQGANASAVQEIKHDSPAVVERAKTLAIDLAKAHGHLHVVKILEVFTENSSDTLRQGINLLQITTDKTQKVSCSQFSIHGLLELAAFLNNESLANHLLSRAKDFSQFCGDIPRRHSMIRSAAYWAAINGNETLFKKLCPTDADAAHALLQLRADHRYELFSKYFTLVSPTARDLLKNGIKKDAEQIHDDAAYTYERACAADLECLKLFSSNFANFFAAVAYAYEKQNYVALYQCILAWKNLTSLKQREFSHYLCQKSLSDTSIPGVRQLTQHNLIEFWLSANQIHPYELLMLVMRKPELRIPLTQQIWSEPGLLQFSISRQLTSSFKPGNQDAEFFLSLEKQNATVLEILNKYLSVRNIPLTSDLHSRFDLVVRQPREVNFYNELGHEIWMKILNQNFLGRPIDVKQVEKSLQNEIEENTDQEEKQPPKKLLSSLPWCGDHTWDPNPSRNVHLVSKRFYMLSKLMNPASLKNRAKKHDEIKQALADSKHDFDHLPQEIEALNLLLQMLDKELKSGSTWKLNWSVHIPVLISLIVFALNCYCADHLADLAEESALPIFNTTPPGYNSTCDVLGRTRHFTDSNGKNLTEFQSWTGICTYSHETSMHAVALCVALCKTYNANWGKVMGSVISAFMTGALGLSGIATSGTRFLKDEEKLRLQLENSPLSSFSKKLRKQAASTLDLGDNKPFSLQSDFKSIRAQTQALLQSKQTLFAKISNERKILSGLQTIYQPPKPVVAKPSLGPSLFLGLEIKEPHRSSNRSQKQKLEEVAIDVHLPTEGNTLRTPLLESKEREGRKSRCLGSMCVIL